MRQALPIIAAVAMFRCAPIASELQSAHLVGRHKAELTTSYANMQFRKPSVQTDEGDTKATRGRLLGVQAAYGLSDHVDLRMRIEQFNFRGKENFVFSIGPKVMVVRDRIALYVPVWFADYKPIQTQPTLLVTIPLVRNKLEFNPSVKSILTVSGYDPMNQVMVGTNFGFAVSTDLNRWSIRPEFGTIYDLKGHNQFGCFAIGITIYFGRGHSKH